MKVQWGFKEQIGQVIVACCPTSWDAQVSGFKPGTRYSAQRKVCVCVWSADGMPSVNAL